MCVLLAIHCSLFISPAGAQTSLYEQNIKLGQLFKSSGARLLAQQCFQTAANESSNEQELLVAQLNLADVLKFSQPVEAVRINELGAETSKKYPGQRQLYLTTTGIVSFLLDDKAEFEKSYDEYLRLCNQYATLSTSYDIAMRAIHEAFDGFYDEALRTLDSPGLDRLTRHDLRISIFRRSGNLQGVVDEQRQRAISLDTLNLTMYRQNNKEAMLTATMTNAQHEAEESNSRLLLLNAIMLALIAIMIIIGLSMKRKEQKKLEKKNEQLMTALKMAGETDQMKKEFVRRVSHEIRTPLNAITGFNDILNNSEIDLGKEERADLMGRINENVRAITTIVDELLQVANAESVVGYAKDDTVLCNQFFSELLYRHKDEVSADIELKYTTQVINRFTIETNADAVEKIIGHLIHNAIKFTQKGSIELNCSEKDGMVVLTLTDTGCGIAAEHQDDIFEEFTKGDAFRPGIGLGLAVSRRIAKKMDGDLVLDKEYTGGARFVLKLPKK